MLSNAAKNSLEQQVARYANQIEAALPYLTSRGITPETATRFRLGHSGDTGNVATSNRLAIPYLTPVGAWHVKYRCIEDHKCKDKDAGGCGLKYSYEPGNVQHLFNAMTLIDADTVVIVEGELDAISVEQAGIHAVAYPGASTWQKTKHWRFCFDSCTEIVVIADGDEPGAKAAAGVAESLRNAVAADVRTVSMPAGMDANSFLSEYGETEFLDLLDWL